jgi:(S)-2-hydroxyglutarate dehydrogenase
MSRSISRENLADIIVIGAGIIGLATAWRLKQRYPRSKVIVLEKESQVGFHQSGHNSGVIHSGIYYKPGSKKAAYCRQGRRQLIGFCDEFKIPYKICGKVIVATRYGQLDQLDRLHERGEVNRIGDLERIGWDKLRKIEPACNGIEALRVGAAGIVDFRQVCRVLAALIRDQGGSIYTGMEVNGIGTGGKAIMIEAGSAKPVQSDSDRTDSMYNDSDRKGSGASSKTSNQVLFCRFLVNCAGLQADRIALMAGIDPKIRIIPFRGDYYKLTRERQHLVRSLIYPLPDENFPFLGVHLTRMINGDVECGPNAVLALAREKYSRWGFEASDVRDILHYQGFRKLVRRHWKTGLTEMQRSLSKRMFARAVQELVPDIKPADLIPAMPGIRANAVDPDGHVVDDFHIERTERQLHVLNAPSPAATASLRIGEEIAAQCRL